ncbi:hypothetical protein JCM8208_003512 [Rhodotorula glutinis]
MSPSRTRARPTRTTTATARSRSARARSPVPPSRPLSSSSTASPSRSRIWTPLLVFLNFLSMVPGLVGFFYSAARFYSTRHLVWASSTWDARGAHGGQAILEARSTRLDWLLSACWALATAYFTLSLARGLLRRWLVYYSTGPTIIRVVSLQAICWPLTLTTHRFLSFDQPVAAWVICATTAAFSNVIQTWVTSNIVERKDRRSQQRWRLLSLAITTVLGPGVRTDKYRRGERVLSWRRVLWGTVLPFALLGWFSMGALLWQQFVARYRGGGGVALGPHPHPYALVDPAAADGAARALTTLPDLDPSAGVRVVVLVTSSWTNRSAVNRHTFRETSVRLFPRPPSSSSTKPPEISVAYRFLLGAPPSPLTAARAGPGIEAEADEWRDMLVVGAPDGYDELSRKVHRGWAWAAGLDVDYVLKTDDDILLRMDVLAKELVQLGRRREYWRGFAYWDIPAIKDASNKNADFAYELSPFPPYTAGALHILSHDLVQLVAPPHASRLFTKNEDQNLGLWLFPSGVRPIHDHRIQQAQVCEDDMLAKHFGSQYTEPTGAGARDMYANIVAGRRPCEGLLQRWCGVCYPSCRRRENHWRQWGYACDEHRGATLSSRAASSPSSTSLEAPVKVLPDARILGSADDPWVVPGLLSRHASSLSATDDWHLLHMVCWTTAPETWQERHYAALETIWAHEPRAVLLVLSTTLDESFLDVYREHGYAVHVVRVGRDEILEREWYLGPKSKEWIERWDKWATGPSFFSHLTDYLRYLFLFKFGGTYLDMDAPWVRSPPDAKVEFIGADHSTLASDVDWTLDESGMYLAPGVMRFRRGWAVFRDIMESAFSPSYSPECFNCVGPRAITSAVRARRYQLELHGFTIVPPHVLYPRNWLAAHELVRALPPGEAHAQLARIADQSWSIHLFGKMTNHLRIQPRSIVAEAFAAFSLGVPRPTGPLSSSADLDDDALDAPPRTLPSSHTALSLRHPPQYTYRARSALARDEVPHLDLLGSLDGRFDGLDLVAVRGALPSGLTSARAEVRLSTARGGKVALEPPGSLGGRTGSGEAGPAAGEEVRFVLDDARLKDINAVLRSAVYVPPSGDEVREDELRVVVEWGGERFAGVVSVSIPGS